MTLITMLIILAVLLLFMLQYTDKRIFVYTKYLMLPENNGGFVTLHFVHGKIPEFKSRQYVPYIKDFLLKMKENSMSGTVVMQIDRHVYGFRVKEHHNWMHLVPNGHGEHLNAEFYKQTFLSWLDETAGENTTSIKIPVTTEQKKDLTDIYTKYMEHTPYDYAFLGMGSASAVYEVLARAKMVFPQESNARYALNAFYPNAFRERVLAWAKYNNFEITTKKAESTG